MRRSRVAATAGPVPAASSAFRQSPLPLRIPARRSWPGRPSARTAARCNHPCRRCASARPASRCRTPGARSPVPARPRRGRRASPPSRSRTRSACPRSSWVLRLRRLARRLRREPSRQRLHVFFGQRRGGCAHHRHRAPAVAVFVQRLQQVLIRLARQVGRAGNARVTILAVASGAQAELRRLRRQRRRLRQGQRHEREQQKGPGRFSHRPSLSAGRRHSACPKHIATMRVCHPRSEAVPTTLLQSELPGLELLHRGKVRDVYALSGDRLLIVASDRLSAFDVVLPDPIPGKGEMLTQVSNFWFGKTAQLVPNHLTGTPVAEVLPQGVDPKLYEKRAVVVKRLKALPVEAIARGYLIGSGWKDYQRSGQLCGIKLPAGLKQAQQLPEPIFTPSTKAPKGTHDENIGFGAVEDLIGADLAKQVRDATLAIYTFAAKYAAERGIIIADTKFDFGTEANRSEERRVGKECKDRR